MSSHSGSIKVEDSADYEAEPTTDARFNVNDEVVKNMEKEIRESVAEVRAYIEGKVDLPLAGDLVFR